MTWRGLNRHVAKETAVGMAINAVVSTAPSLMQTGLAVHAAPAAVREVAHGLVPSFFMAALMSALVPSLLTCWKGATGRLGIAWPGRLHPGRAILIASTLAVVFTPLSLALIHLFVAPFAVHGLGTSGIVALRCAQAVLAAAVVTPAALLLLCRRASL